MLLPKGAVNNPHREATMARFGMKSLGFGAIIVSLVAAAAAFSVTSPAGLATLSSSGVVTGGSASTKGNTADSATLNKIAAGDTATWTDSYQNTSADVAAGEVIQRWDPAKASFQAGSLSVPNGWTGTYSTDGITFSSSTPADASTVKAVKASAAFVPAAGRSGVVEKLSPPTVSSLTTIIPGGGDSFHVVFYKQNVYSILHHEDFKVFCFRKADGSTCGSVAPSRPIKSSDHADAWVDQATGNAYIPGIDVQSGTNNVVLSCVSLETMADCGITKLDTGGIIRSGSQVSQPWFFGGQVMFLYTHAPNNELLVGCMTVATKVPCAGQPFSAGLGFPVGVSTDEFRKTHVYWSPDGRKPYRSDGKVSFTAVQTGTTTRSLACFDSTTHAACASVVRAGWAAGQSPFPRLDAADHLVGFCARPSGTQPVSCYDLAGATMSASPSLETWAPKGQISWAGSLGGYAVATDGRTFIPQSAMRPEAVPCFDWRADTACAGFPYRSTISTKAYSVRADSFASNCIWKMGDDGILETFDSVGAASDCATSSITAKPVYCDASPTHVTGWESVRINNLAPGAQTGFSLTLRDGNGVVLPGWSAKRFSSSTSVIDIHSVPYAGEITAAISFSGLKASAFVGATPTVEISWKGDPLQICSKTVVRSVCPPLYSAVLPGAVGHLSEATTFAPAAPDKAIINLAFDYQTPASCGITKVAMTAAVNGQHPTSAPGLDVPAGQPATLVYTLSNTGPTILLQPTVVDDSGTPNDTSDDPTIIGLSGDRNGDGRLDPGETWIVTATGKTENGQHVSHAVLTGSPADAAGQAVGEPIELADTVYYFVSEPQVALFAGLVAGSGSAATCANAKPLLVVPVKAAIAYCYVVKNNGNVELKSIKIDDSLGVNEKDLTVVSGSLSHLAPGESVVLFVNQVNTGPLVTDVTVTAHAAGHKVTAHGRTERRVLPIVYPAT
jgi:hypothetical protein